MSDESEFIFIDTNILIYAHDSSAGGKRQKAQELLTQLGESRRGALSLQVLQEFFVIVTGKIRNPLEAQEALQIIADFGTWRLHEPTLRDVIGAGEIHQRYRISFWDAMIVGSASRLGCSVLYSEDLNSGQDYEGVRCTNPFV
ncbi:MAG: PIN domain-containing protein [Actinomycetota bacterium]